MGLVDPDGDAPAVTARLWQRFNAVVNAAVTRVVVGSTGARLLTFNEHPHLTEDLPTYREPRCRSAVARVVASTRSTQHRAEAQMRAVHCHVTFAFAMATVVRNVGAGVVSV